MKSFEKLNKKKDLTRWNRAGLKQFKYIDGNAITYLESLRQELVEQYDNGGIPAWDELISRFPESSNETRYQEKKRLKGQYYDDRRDYAWEILRTFSRSAHVLGEYINAYANESYLPTATEWDNVRKLVAMLNYTPSPPASAETYVALLYKKDSQGEIDKGFAVKNKPAKGDSTVIFESQEKLTGSFILNQFHLKNWNKNLKPLYERAKNKQGIAYGLREYLQHQTFNYYLEEKNDDINVGDVGVIASSIIGFPIQVMAIDEDEKGYFVRLKSTENTMRGLTLYNTSLYLKADFISSPLPNGSRSAELKKAASLNDNEIVFTEKDGKYLLRRIVGSEGKLVEFSENEESLQKGEKIHRSRTLVKQSNNEIDSRTFYLLPNDYKGENVIFFNEQLAEVANSKDIISKKIDASGNIGATIGKVLFRYIVGPYGQEIYYADKEIQAEIKEVGDSVVTDVSFSGKSTKLESDHWCLVKHKSGVKKAYKISQINNDENSFSLSLKDSSETISLLRSAFKLSLRHKKYDTNQSRVGRSDGVGSATVLELENDKQFEHLTLGKKLICACETKAVVVEIKDIKRNVSGISLYVSPAIHHENEFTRQNTIIYGNVVRMTHGETQAEKIVGNGDASQSNQCFDLTSKMISWLADAAFNTGVRADLNLRVGHRIWQQVQDLSFSTPEAHHYQVKVNEDNGVTVCFGDGRHGRRLPTGIDNIRVRYRNGYGEEGNLDAMALVKIARPNPLIESFYAPLPALGGAEKETPESMRDSAPETVLALSRAVSLDDFTHLASHHSMVWQAMAFERMPDRPARSKIDVVVVAAGGAVFTAGSETARLIQSYLMTHAAPGTPVCVYSYQALLMALKIFVMVDEQAFDKNKIELAVREHLESQLMIKMRKLGQPLFRSEIIALLEQVEGVENGHCEILETPYTSIKAEEKPKINMGSDGQIRKISINPEQLLYLDTKHYPIQMVSLEYEL